MKASRLLITPRGLEDLEQDCGKIVISRRLLICFLTWGPLKFEGFGLARVHFQRLTIVIPRFSHPKTLKTSAFPMKKFLG